MSKQETIEGISKQKSDYNHPSQAEDLANSLDTISDDIYSENERFVYELIQNADDASEPEQNDLEIKIEFTQNFVIISHNGRGFNDKDISAISSVGKSQKSENPDQTGYKGIGFKSVFGKSDCVYINSNGFCFRYDKSHWMSHSNKMPWQIIPIWSGDSIPEELVKTKFGKYPVSTAIQFSKDKEFVGADLKNTLINLFSNSQIMLFLRNVTLISVGENFSIKRTKKELSGTEAFRLSAVSLTVNDKQTNWIIGDFIGIELDSETRTALKQDEKAPKRLKETQFTNISFAGKINDKGELVKITENSLVFTYLPTKINKGFPFLVNADFLTNAPREGFHEDRIWNIWLFEQVGSKSIEWLRELASTDYRYQITNVLAKTFHPRDQMEKAFNEGYKKAIQEITFIPNRDGKLLLAEDALIEKTDIEEVIGTDVLIEYINTVHDTNFTEQSIVSKELSAISGLTSLGVKVFKTEDLKGLFDSDLMSDQLQVEDNFEIIKFLYEKSDSESWKKHIPEIPFIFNEKEELCTPIKPIYLPIEDFETELNQDFDFIHSEILEKIEGKYRIKRWLQELGVVAPTPKNIIEKTISPNLESLTDAKEKSIETVRYLFENQNQISDLSNFGDIQLITTKGVLKKASTCYLSDFYKPELAIEKHLPNEDFFVSSEYVVEVKNLKEWNLFLTRLGVNESFKRIEYPYINIKKLRKTFNSPFLDFATKWARAQISGEGGFEHRSDFKNLRVITCMEQASESYTFSKLFWEEVFQNKLITLADMKEELILRKFHTYTPMNYFRWYLKEYSCFPSTQKELRSPNKLIINRPNFRKIGGDGLPVLDLDIELPQEIENDTEFFNFRPTIKLEEYLKVLADISNAERLESGTTERIGLIYKDLLDFTRTQEKEIIKEWGKSNKLLSTHNKFIGCEKLHFLDIEEFELPSEVEGFVKIPSEVKKQAGLVDLFTLFGVKIINYQSLGAKKNNPETDTELQIRLSSQLPLIALVVAQKENKEYKNVLNELQKTVNQASFFKAEKLYLDCTVEGKQIFTVQKTALAEDGAFYYAGKWNSPITLYDLTSEICAFLSIEDISKELNVLLLVSFDDGLEWLETQKYEIGVVPKQAPETDKSHEGDSRSDIQKGYSENIGEISEKFVYEELIAHYKSKYAEEAIHIESGATFKTDSVEIIWHRASGNRYEDRDITVNEKGVEKYIEVKATKDSERVDSTLFLSYNEWGLMKRSDSRYYIARVFNGHEPTEAIFVKMEKTDFQV